MEVMAHAREPGVSHTAFVDNGRLLATSHAHGNARL